MRIHLALVLPLLLLAPLALAAPASAQGGAVVGASVRIVEPVSATLEPGGQIEQSGGGELRLRLPVRVDGQSMPVITIVGRESGECERPQVETGRTEAGAAAGSRTLLRCALAPRAGGPSDSARVTVFIASGSS